MPKLLTRKLNDVSVVYHGGLLKTAIVGIL